MPFLPAYDLLGPAAEGPVAFFCHGILGSGRNWRTIALRLLEGLPGWRIALLDQRHHGRSVGAPPPATVEACAEDVERLADHLAVVPSVIVGHSFGGKVALAAAARRPAGLRAVWVLDAVPSAVPLALRPQADPLAVIAAMRRVPLPLPRRTDVVAGLRAEGLSQAVASWLATNLSRGPEGFRWTLDLDAIEALLASYFERDLWGPIESRDPSAPRVEVVRAGRSDRWTPAVLQRFEALPPGAAGRLSTLPRAGHWLHVDDPDGLVRLLLGRWGSGPAS